MSRPATALRLAAALIVAALPLRAGTLTVTPTELTVWKPVFGEVAAKDTVEARARIGGTVTDLAVTEGDRVAAGQHLGTVVDEKLGFQIAALDARTRALEAQLATAQTELQRGQALVERGVITSQRLDQLATDADVARNQLAATRAEREVVVQQSGEGEVTAPGDGRVLRVPVTRGAVILPGESLATIGSGGVFLRIAIPERHAAALTTGAVLKIGSGAAQTEGRLARIYPQIESGRVIADVAVTDPGTEFVGLRLLVQVPVGQRSALVVPRAAVTTRNGLDFVTVAGPDGPVLRTVLIAPLDAATPGDAAAGASPPDNDRVEIVSGLAAGETLVLP